MPWLSEAMKDVISCDKLRGGANNLWSGDFRMGQPGVLKTRHLIISGANAGNWNILVPAGKENNNDSPSSGEPHGTGSLSVSREYLALPDGPGRFTQNSSCSALLRILLCFDNIRIRNCHALWSFFPESSSPMSSCNDVVLQPRSCRNMNGLGYSPFARHYWGNHCLFSFPAGTKMFQFPALASNNVG